MMRPCQVPGPSLLVNRRVSPTFTRSNSPAPMAVSSSNEPGAMNSPKRVPGVTMVPGSTGAFTTIPSNGADIVYLSKRSYTARML